MTVKEVAKISGVSVRTLHYYDQIGLLRPAQVTQAGYRIYGEEELIRLQQILLYRELDFPLVEIRRLMEPDTSGNFEARRDALEKQRSLLGMKRDRLTGLIALTERLLKGEEAMSFQEFDETRIEAEKKKYAKEVEERWGGTEAYAESQQRTASYGKEDWARIQEEMNGIFQRFADSMEENPACEKPQALVEEWKGFITANFYPCTNEILAGLGEMYTEDERFRQNFEKTAPGLGSYIAEAIKHYCS